MSNLVESGREKTVWITAFVVGLSDTTNIASPFPENMTMPVGTLGPEEQDEVPRNVWNRPRKNVLVSQ